MPSLLVSLLIHSAAKSPCCRDVYLHDALYSDTGRTELGTVEVAGVTTLVPSLHQCSFLLRTVIE